MKDEEIVELYWQRSEDAIKETSVKYQAYLSKIAYNILSDFEDSKECVNDTYLAAWNSMPEHRPSILSTYLGKITRQIAIDVFRKKSSMKRYTTEYALSLSELEDSFADYPAPTPGHNHNWEWGTITEPTEYSDGMEGYICTICGATKDTVTIPSTGVFMENKYNQVKNAKAGETVVLEMGPWHSLSKGFMEEIAKRRDVTFVIHFIYEGKKYEVVIPAGRPLVLDPSIDWYGPLKQNEMFGMKEIM